MENRLNLTLQVHQDLLKCLKKAKEDFLEVRGVGKYAFRNLIKWWRFNMVIRSWAKAWDYDAIAIYTIERTGSPECMVEPINEMNDLLVNYKDDIVGVLSYAYGKEVANEFFNIYSFGGRI